MPISLTCLILAASPFLQGGDNWSPGDPYFPNPSAMPHYPTWIPLDEHGRQNVGAMPTFSVQSSSQGGDESMRVLAQVHGFWVKPNRSSDSEVDRSFLEFRVPGMGVTDAVGLPQLPVVSGAIGLPGTASEVKLVAPDMRLFAKFDNARVVPFQGADLEPEGGDGSPRPFIIDQSFYQGHQGAWPEGAGQADAGPDRNFGRVPYASTDLQMFKYDPSLNQLRVAREIEFDLTYRSAGSDPIEISRSWARSLQQFLPNYDWLIEKRIIEIAPIGWRGRYLVIHPKAWHDQLRDLITLKRQRGYSVQRIEIESMGGADSEDFFEAIADWYADGESAAEHYVLLVGDTSRIPHRQTSVANHNGVIGQSDMRYAFLHSETCPSLWIGRLPAMSASECETMVRKSVEYQTKMFFDIDFYETATLAAHPGEADAYLDCIDAIMAQDHLYQRPRNFIDRGGDTADGRDNLVMSDIDDKHVGVVMYRGHGSTNSWSPWDFDGNAVNDADLGTLADTTYSPVVFSVSCSNHGIQNNADAIGREWMYYEAGASSSIGAMHPSYRWQNNTFAEYTWVYLQSNNLHSVAATTMSALNAAAATHGDQWSRWNQQVYSVFGDPEMRVYNRAPFQLRLLLESFQIFQPELPIDILVFGDGNQVIPEAIVTLSGPQGPIFTGMSGADGRLQIPAGLDVGDAQELTLRAWVDDRNGMDAVQTIAVDQGSNSAAAEDLNGDGAIDGADLALLLASWGQPGDADFDGNGAVDGADLARLLGAWD